jgi:hypothetical protein
MGLESLEQLNEFNRIFPLIRGGNGDCQEVSAREGNA